MSTAVTGEPTPPRGPVPTRPSGSARRTPFTVFVVALFTLGLVGQLLLNTALQHGSFDLHTLTLTASALEERRQALDQRLAAQEEPGRLARLAADLGMVPSENPVFLRIADGGVAGTPVAATAPPPPPPPPSTAPPATAPPTTAPPTTAHATTAPATTPAPSPTP